jgi:hypothetical protein
MGAIEFTEAKLLEGDQAFLDGGVVQQEYLFHQPGQFAHRGAIASAHAKMMHDMPFRSAGQHWEMREPDVLICQQQPDNLRLRPH